jgi:hypothetical protein
MKITKLTKKFITLVEHNQYIVTTCNNGNVRILLWNEKGVDFTVTLTKEDIEKINKGEA